MADPISKRPSKKKTPITNARKSRTAKAALRRHDADAGFRSIFEHVAIPLLTYNKKGIIDHWNKAFELLLQHDGKGLKGKPFFETLVGTKGDQRIDKLVRSVFQGRTNTDIHWRVKPVNGASRVLAVSTFPVEDVNGKVAFGMAMFSDITEKKALERALLHTEKMAAMGTLASGLAHELGTPMNVILGRAESLVQSTKEAKTAKGLMIIIEQIDRMTELINRLLAFARKAPITRMRIDVNALIDKSIELMAQQIRKKKITVQTALDPNLPTIWGDADQIVQIMINLFMNAFDALPRGGRISIETLAFPVSPSPNTTTRRPGQSAPTIRVIFKDNGSGIEAEQLNKIFDPFFTTKPVGKGTGLGLAVVNGIVREHGGQIEVSSLQNQGTTFTLSLPSGRGMNTDTDL